MKKTLLSIIVLAAAAFGADAKATPKKPVAKKPAAAPVKAVTIPKDAVANPNGTWSWKDAKGVNWTYVQTPFGVMRSQTPDATPVAAAPSLANVKIVESGDKVVFEQATPFGVVRREKNKMELTEEERQLLERQKAKQE